MDISHKMTLSGAMMLESEAVWRVLVKKGLPTNEEVLEEIKAVRPEMEEKRGKVKVNS